MQVNFELDDEANALAELIASMMDCSKRKAIKRIFLLFGPAWINQQRANAHETDSTHHLIPPKGTSHLLATRADNAVRTEDRGHKAKRAATSRPRSGVEAV